MPAKTTAKQTKAAALRSDIGPYGVIPLWLVIALKKDSHALSVFAYLAAKHADRETGMAKPNKRTIADALGMSISMVDRALAVLRRVGALDREERFDPRKGGRQTSNLYSLHFTRPLDPISPVTGGAHVTSDTPPAVKYDTPAHVTGEAPDPSPTTDQIEPVTMEPMAPNTDRPTYHAPSVNAAKSNFAGDKRAPALKQARRRLNEAGDAFNRLNQRHDVAPTLATMQALAEADGAYRTAAQAVRELEREPDTPVPKTTNTPPPAFKDRAVTRLGG